jgi:zinc transport system substrate-binding protein
MIPVLIDVLAWALVRVLCSLLVVFAAGCGGGDDDGRTVVAGFYPLAWAAEQSIGQAPGESSAVPEVVNLTPAGAEPHDLELSARDVERVRDAELVVYVGGGFQPALEEAVAERDGPSLDVLLTAEERDPHVWLDPVRFARIVTDVDAALGAGATSADVFLELDVLDREFRRGLARCERREIVTTHAAFGHLAARYGLDQLALTGSSPEAEPSPRELEQLIDDVREAGATTVFAEPLVSDSVAQTVAREAGARVAVLDPLEGLSEERLQAGEDYVSVMRDNLAALREALGCR